MKTLVTLATDQMIILVNPGSWIPGPEAMDQQTDVGIVPLRLENMSDQVVRVDVVHSRQAGRHGGCTAQSGGVAAERGCGVENGFQGAVEDTGRCGVESGDGLAGGFGGDGVWGDGEVGGVGVEGVKTASDSLAVLFVF